MENELVLFSRKPSGELSGISADNPVFDLKAMGEMADIKLAELDALSNLDLKTKEARKQVELAVKLMEKDFKDFETNIKAVKKMTSDIPKKCDAVSLLVRNKVAAAVAKAEAPLAKLKAQAEFVKIWESKKVPETKYELEAILQTTKNTQLVECSNGEEALIFTHRKAQYLHSIEDALKVIAEKERLETEARQRQAEEAARLAKEREELEAEKQKQMAEQARIAAEQRKQQEALEAEKRRIAQEAAALERQKQQAAVNPGEPLEAKETAAGAPPAISTERRKEVWREIEDKIAEEIRKLMYENRNAADDFSIAIRKAIVLGKIPHLAINYGEGV